MADLPTIRVLRRRAAVVVTALACLARLGSHGDLVGGEIIKILYPNSLPTWPA